MSNKKLNSIEWLYNQMSNLASGYATELNQQEILEQAKAMHKKEIIDAWIADDNDLQRLRAEQYYNEIINN